MSIYDERRIGPKRRLYRIRLVDTRLGFQIQTFNTASYRWQFDGIERAKRVADQMVRYGIAEWCPTVDDRKAG